MTEPVPADAVWAYDYIDHYRLDEKIIGNFLETKWGRYMYCVKARSAQPTNLQVGRPADLAQREGDLFRFWVPRPLNEVGCTPSQGAAPVSDKGI